ncbi:MAG: prepilin-type N-terminal cleavage/methylation domain-containing protein [Deltaproteobacteria bacterium]|nr:prepilin-type N-terminal cleavage/methylation domain-containing protein [Deltaproteobacteria bacterium]
MLSSLCNKRGITLIELMIAALITAVGIMALLSMHPTAWRATGRSDLMGRAAGILNEELETNEMLIMNPCNPIPAPTTRPVWTSGAVAAQPGDFTYQVETTPTVNPDGSCLVTVRVTWPGNDNGIADSILVTMQERYRFPQGCASVR